MPNQETTKALPISVVIPAYNAAEWISRAINSVLTQTMPPLEIIVVDDGSADNTSGVCSRFGEHVRLIQQANGGAATARNRGVAEACGDWIAFLDADDEWLPHRLEAQWAILQNRPDVHWAAGAYALYRGRRLRAIRSLPETVLFENGCVDAYALLAAGSGLICTDTIIVRRDIWRQVGGMDAAFRTGQDRDMWLRLANCSRYLAYVVQPIAKYHVLASTNSTSTKVKRRDLSAVMVARKHMATLNSLPLDAQEAVKSHLRRSLLLSATTAVQQGAVEMAQAFVAGVEELGLGPVPTSLYRKLQIPPWIWAWQWRIRSMLRQLLVN